MWQRSASSCWQQAMTFPLRIAIASAPQVNMQVAIMQARAAAPMR